MARGRVREAASGGIKGTEVIRDPAVASAAAKCWLARFQGMVIIDGSYHPEPCSLCEYDMDYLIGAVREFLAWSGHQPGKDPVPLRQEVEGFLTLPREEQARAVRAIQYG